MTYISSCRWSAGPSPLPAGLSSPLQSPHHSGVPRSTTLTAWESTMSEQRSREAPEAESQPVGQEEVQRDARPHPLDEFRSYSLELLATLEG